MTREQLPPELPFHEEDSPQVEEDEPQAHIRAPSGSPSTWPYLIFSFYVVLANAATTVLLTMPIAVISWFLLLDPLFSGLPAGIEREKEPCPSNGDKLYAFQALHFILSLIIGQIWTVYVMLRNRFADQTLEFEDDFLIMHRHPAVRRYLVYFTCVFLGFAAGLHSYPFVTTGCGHNSSGTARVPAQDVHGGTVNEAVQDAGLPEPPIPSNFPDGTPIPDPPRFSLPLSPRHGRYGPPRPLRMPEIPGIPRMPPMPTMPRMPPMPMPRPPGP